MKETKTARNLRVLSTYRTNNDELHFERGENVSLWLFNSCRIFVFIFHFLFSMTISLFSLSCFSVNYDISQHAQHTHTRTISPRVNIFFHFSFFFCFSAFLTAFCSVILICEQLTHPLSNRENKLNEWERIEMNKMRVAVRRKWNFFFVVVFFVVVVEFPFQSISICDEGIRTHRQSTASKHTWTDVEERKKMTGTRSERYHVTYAEIFFLSKASMRFAAVSDGEERVRSTSRTKAAAQTSTIQLNSFRSFSYRISLTICVNVQGCNCIVSYPAQRDDEKNCGRTKRGRFIWRFSWLHQYDLTFIETTVWLIKRKHIKSAPEHIFSI